MNYKLIIIAAFFALGCNSTPNYSKNKVPPRFTIKKINTHWDELQHKEFKISYPNQWTLDTSGANGTRFIVLSQRIDSFDQFSENINLFTEVIGNITLATYVQKSEEQVKSFMKNGKLLQSKDTLINEIAAHKTKFIANSDGIDLVFDQIYFVVNQKAYVLTYSCEEKEYGLMYPLANKVMGSFSVLY